MTASLSNPGNSSTPDRDDIFTRWVHEHAHFLYRVAVSLLRHPQDAEDAVQDALLKLYRGESWRGASGAAPGIQNERAFLARVVWRAALDRRNRQSLLADGAELRMPDSRPTPERAVAYEDERLLLHELIDALPADLRAPLLLSAMEELNSREIGEVIGIPEGTVRTRLMRARAELRAAFEARQAGRCRKVAG